MNKYLRYMITQHFLNEMMPPIDSHKINGSSFIYDMFNMCMFFKTKPKKSCNTITQPKVDVKKVFQENYDASKKKCDQQYINFVNYKSPNIIIRLLMAPIQLWCKYITGFIILVCKPFNKSRD